MNILTALQISLFDFAVVFAALVLIAFFIKIVSWVISYFEKSNRKANNAAGEAGAKMPEYQAEAANKALTDNTIGHGELKLYGVDEKTAAMIMAIVSDESKIPLKELRFKSIKLLEN